MGALEQGPQHDPAKVAAWVRSAQGGDQAAWGLLVRAYSPRVFALAKSRLRNTDMAEEVTQSVFVTIAQHIAQGRYDEQHKFEPWLFRIVMNRVRDAIRQTVRDKSETRLRFAAKSEVAQPESAQASGTDMDLHSLRSALEALSAPDREIIELRYHAGMGFRQIADLLKEPFGTLLARHHRALRKLRTIIESAKTELCPTPTCTTTFSTTTSNNTSSPSTHHGQQGMPRTAGEKA